MGTSTRSRLTRNKASNPAKAPAGPQPDTKRNKGVNPRKRITYTKWEIFANLLLGYKADLIPLENILEDWFYELDTRKAFKSQTNARYHWDSLKLVIQDYCGINYMVKLGQIKNKKGDGYENYKMFHLQK